jgi:peptidylprolyl isomerase
MGFYETAAARTPITSVRVAADLPATERIAVEVLRDDSRSFERLLDARRHRRDDWMKLSPGYIDVCNMPIPVRPAA